jgi:hypothetical protein
MLSLLLIHCIECAMVRYYPTHSFVLMVYNKKQRGEKIESFQIFICFDLFIFHFSIFVIFEEGLFLGCLITIFLFVLQ